MQFQWMERELQEQQLGSYQPLQPGKVVNWLIISRPSMCSINLPEKY
jgi:hypothetical protein